MKNQDEEKEEERIGRCRAEENRDEGKENE